MTSNENIAVAEQSYKGRAPSVSKLTYKRTLLELQIELVKMQKHIIKSNEKILIILEGRDASGKDGTIKRIVKHLSPRETRIVALGIPSDRDRNSWYFQRYIANLPASQELVLFNRSWYNRAGVERVMGFCTEAEYLEFMESVSSFESMLVRVKSYFCWKSGGGKRVLGWLRFAWQNRSLVEDGVLRVA